ncbi:MAG TPA: L-histidine N(alpha)-methyltransferase, partial [Nitrospira sp.]
MSRADAMLSQALQTDGVREFAVAVSESLGKAGQRELPSMYLYDELGTALFEAITLLPEYGLTRAEERLLRRHAGALLERIPSPLAVVELGSGTGRKTRWILEALADREPVAYFPIDISAAALLRCHQELGHLGAVSMVGLEKSYLDGLHDVTTRRRSEQTLLVLFLGSSIGNFDQPAAEQFLRDIRRLLKRGDALLLGTDVEKSVNDMLLAYNDPTGVTAAFNLNLLARINRELGGNFFLPYFEHHVRYQEPAHRIEMHLRSTRDQIVSIQAANFRCIFREGETIWTEACHKFRVEDV